MTGVASRSRSRSPRESILTDELQEALLDADRLLRPSTACGASVPHAQRLFAVVLAAASREELVREGAQSGRCSTMSFVRFISFVCSLLVTHLLFVCHSAVAHKEHRQRNRGERT